MYAKYRIIILLQLTFLGEGQRVEKKPREQGVLEDYSNIQSASFVIAYLDLSAPIFLVNILRKPNLYCSLTRLHFHNPVSTFSLTACFFFFFSLSLLLLIQSSSWFKQFQFSVSPPKQGRLQNLCQFNSIQKGFQS